jgi:hypothetical protein
MAVAMKYGRVSARISGLAVVRCEGIYCGSWRVDSGTEVVDRRLYCGGMGNGGGAGGAEALEHSFGGRLRERGEVVVDTSAHSDHREGAGEQNTRAGNARFGVL